MRILLDTNILIDIALRRMPHFTDSASVFDKIDNDTILGFVTATTITDLYYIAKKERGHQVTIAFINNLIEVVDILGIDKKIIIASIISEFTDFEDAIQSIASQMNSIDYIITRDKNDFIKSEIKALTPKDFLELLKKKE